MVAMAAEVGSTSPAWMRSRVAWSSDCRVRKPRMIRPSWDRETSTGYPIIFNKIDTFGISGRHNRPLRGPPIERRGSTIAGGTILPEACELAIGQRERPAAWGTTGLTWESAWVWDIEALGCVGRGLR